MKTDTLEKIMIMLPAFAIVVLIVVSANLILSLPSAEEIIEKNKNTCQLKVNTDTSKFEVRSYDEKAEASTEGFFNTKLEAIKAMPELCPGKRVVK